MKNCKYAALNLTDLYFGSLVNLNGALNGKLVNLKRWIEKLKKVRENLHA